MLKTRTDPKPSFVVATLYHKACWGDYKGTKTVKRRVRSPEIIKSQTRENLTPQALTRNHRKLWLEISGTHNPEVAGSNPVPATIRKVPNSLRIGYFLLLLCLKCSIFQKPKKLFFCLFINNLSTSAIWKLSKHQKWGLGAFFRSPYIYMATPHK